VNDGKIIIDNLRKINKDESWLDEQLKKYGTTDLKNVFLAGIDGTGQSFYSFSGT